MKQTKTFDKTLETLLTDAGLSEKESVIYRSLLEEGALSAPAIVKKTRLKKGITYALLYKLAKEGLLVQFEKEGILRFQPADPLSLKTLVEKRKKAIDDTLERIEHTLPVLRSAYKLAVGKPTIHYYEGVEGIKTVFEDIYAKKSEPVYGCVDFEKSDEAVPSYIVDKLIPRRIRNGVRAVSLIADSPESRYIVAKDKDQLRETKLVSKLTHPLPAEIDIYEDKIAMLSFAKGEFIGILIENHDFAESLRSIFRLAFTSTPKIPEDREKNAGSQTGGL